PPISPATYNSPLHLLIFSTYTPTPKLFSLSLHDALPICSAVGPHGAAARRLHRRARPRTPGRRPGHLVGSVSAGTVRQPFERGSDRKSTRLNSSHVKISYAVVCLKKKKERVECLYLLVVL